MKQRHLFTYLYPLTYLSIIALDKLYSQDYLHILRSKQLALMLTHIAGETSHDLVALVGIDDLNN